MAAPPPVRFGVFELDLQTRELRKHGIRLKLQEQPFHVLQALLERPGEVVSREELQHRICPGGAFVDFDQSLNRAINKLREALGDGAGIPRFIETLPRRGYRFIAPVERAPTPEPDRSPAFQTKVVGIEERRMPRWVFTAGGAAALLTIVVAPLTLSSFREKPAATPVIRVALGPPENTSFYLADGTIRSIAVSPDGRRVAFGVRSGRDNQLWVRSLDGLTAEPLPGTENSAFPFWSPDSRSLAFASGGKLKKVDLGGGPVLTLAAAPNLRGGTWSRGGVILFAPSLSGPLQRVPANGGESGPVTRNDGANEKEERLWPWFLPDGRHFLFATPSASSSGHFTIRAGSLDSPETTTVLVADSNAVFAEGRLLFRRESTLMAQPFDARRLTTTGPPLPVAENVGRLLTGMAAFSVSENGVLVYATRRQKQLTWLDREGKPLARVGDPGLLGRLHLSPDQTRAAVAVTSGDITNIWIYDLTRGLRTRFPLDPGVEMIGVWSPDGRTVAFDSSRKGRHDLYRRAADGTGNEELLYADNLEKGPSSWSPDGQWLLYNALSPGSQWDVWVLPLSPKKPDASAQPYPFLQTAFNEQQAQFSPDGQWVLYQSDESGRGEIYVTRFPVPRGKRRISMAGGSQPRWRRDGKEIFYISPEGNLTVVPVTMNRAIIEVGEPRALFGPLMGDQGFTYDVSADGRRFLAETSWQGNALAGNDALILVQNWAAGVK
jgi:Tol biopolymer transport system component/DNA-binding winged helix-turn-helix (wHTH) protein